MDIHKTQEALTIAESFVAASDGYFAARDQIIAFLESLPVAEFGIGVKLFRTLLAAAATGNSHMASVLETYANLVEYVRTNRRICQVCNAGEIWPKEDMPEGKVTRHCSKCGQAYQY